ncbi:hypothetical protein BDV30DRAFT_223795 [Aspergillus minisclerotigenes]|uniref:Altered inheritance of mitochondria protein 9, mitochondrial n=1 Tax=Aspergillus minisclerotigenes TaxID=656917 RepID=A0A5N6JEX5_9EURO|nr:hypothetical protein BDV30DRAFT_223795 [Aspergillus minisclerotigenes]
MRAILGLPVLEVLGWNSNSSNPVRSEYIIMEKAKGTPLGRQLYDYATSIGINERTWAMQYANPRMNYYRSNTESEMPTEYIDLIEKYLRIVPHITHCEPDTANLLQPTLWHSDLHVNNIYVDLDTETITDIIDWQNITVAPLLLQAKIPRMARHISPLPLGWVMPEKPEGYETFSQKDKLKADKLYESALCQKYYEVCTAKMNPRHYAAIIRNDTWKSPLILPEVFRLRSSLTEVFTEEERKLHNEEMENRDYIEGLMEEFQDAGILPSDGMVDPEDYEVVQKTNHAQKEKFMSLAEDEEQREWMDKIWPYQDRPSEA